MSALPPGPFACILADPPWGFRTYSGDDAVPTLADDPYPTMTLDDLCALPVADIAAADCLLVMWVAINPAWKSDATKAREEAEAVFGRAA